VAPLELRFRAMGSPCAVRIHPQPGLDAAGVAAAARAEVWRLECKYSRYRDDSLASRINRSAGDPAGIDVDPETAALLDYAAAAFAASDGLFDISSGPLRRAWKLDSGRLPEPAEIEAALACVGFDRVGWRRPRIALPVPGMELDFGGYVKEYAADRAADLCRRLGARSGLVDLGGDLAVVGPHPDGSPWRVGIRDPRAPERALARIGLRFGGIATSGDYERCIRVDGRRYGHILDPKTGWPVAGLTSASAVAERCLVAGTATTVALLRGAAGPGWLAALGLPHLWVDAEGQVGGTLQAQARRARSEAKPSEAQRARGGTTSTSGVKPASRTRSAAEAASATDA
jgi:thiamine biosynthesis lipoprotein